MISSTCLHFALPEPLSACTPARVHCVLFSFMIFSDTYLWLLNIFFPAWNSYSSFIKIAVPLPQCWYYFFGIHSILFSFAMSSLSLGTRSSFPWLAPVSKMIAASLSRRTFSIAFSLWLLFLPHGMPCEFRQTILIELLLGSSPDPPLSFILTVIVGWFSIFISSTFYSFYKNVHRSLFKYCDIHSPSCTSRVSLCS